MSDAVNDEADVEEVLGEFDIQMPSGRTPKSATAGRLLLYTK